MFGGFSGQPLGKYDI